MDPLTALAAVSAAVNLVKKAVKTVDDVRSLGPVLGKYFDAKADAVKVLEESQKNGFQSSNMAKAVELELAIAEAEKFELQVKDLFFPHNMDVWEKIINRRAQMDADDKAQRRRAADAAVQLRKKRKAAFELWTAIALALFVFVILMWVGLEIVYYCREVKCGN
jgi:hypothetical protein